VVPGIGRRSGRYYWLAPGVEFIPHSQLGGHWWEGRPFQTGEWSTVERPPPAWVDGAIPAGGSWPSIHCCQGLWPQFTCTRARLTMVRLSDGQVVVREADSISQVDCRVGAIYDVSLFLANGVTLGDPVVPNNFSASFCGPISQQLEAFFDHGIADPLYRISLRRSLTSVIWPTTQLCTQASSVRVDFFGPLV
jgi:hypothetical protein